VAAALAGAVVVVVVVQVPFPAIVLHRPLLRPLALHQQHNVPTRTAATAKTELRKPKAARATGWIGKKKVGR
jgi:hypothetical protein